MCQNQALNCVFLLLRAAQNGHSALVNALVVSGACPLTQRFDGSGNSALHVAAAQVTAVTIVLFVDIMLCLGTSRQGQGQCTRA